MNEEKRVVVSVLLWTMVCGAAMGALFASFVAAALGPVPAGMLGVGLLVASFMLAP